MRQGKKTEPRNTYSAKAGVKNAGRSGNKGQSLIEYAMIATVVTAAIIAMSTYVNRSVQATQQMIQEEFSSN
jgi:Flp pilus assembly pilin Flp